MHLKCHNVLVSAKFSFLITVIIAMRSLFFCLLLFYLNQHDKAREGRIKNDEHIGLVLCYGCILHKRVHNRISSDCDNIAGMKKQSLVSAPRQTTVMDTITGRSCYEPIVIISKIKHVYFRFEN
jgi:hypothetical protein